MKFRLINCGSEISTIKWNNGFAPLSWSVILVPWIDQISTARQYPFSLLTCVCTAPCLGSQRDIWTYVDPLWNVHFFEICPRFLHICPLWVHIDIRWRWTVPSSEVTRHESAISTTLWVPASSEHSLPPVDLNQVLSRLLEHRILLLVVTVGVRGRHSWLIRIKLGMCNRDLNVILRGFSVCFPVTCFDSRDAVIEVIDLLVSVLLLLFDPLDHLLDAVHL